MNVNGECLFQSSKSNVGVYVNLMVLNEGGSHLAGSIGVLNATEQSTFRIA